MLCESALACQSSVLGLCSALMASAASCEMPTVPLPLLEGLLKGRAPLEAGADWAPLPLCCVAKAGPPTSSRSSMLRVMLAVTSSSCPPRFSDTWIWCAVDKGALTWQQQVRAHQT